MQGFDQNVDGIQDLCIIMGNWFQALGAGVWDFWSTSSLIYVESDGLTTCLQESELDQSSLLPCISTSPVSSHL